MWTVAAFTTGLTKVGWLGLEVGTNWHSMHSSNEAGNYHNDYGHDNSTISFITILFVVISRPCCSTTYIDAAYLWPPA